MPVLFDPEAASAAFTQPNHDGSFPPDFEAYLHELGQTRPTILLAFAPKAAGTYLRSAAIAAVNGQLVRTVHAQGGRDASFYLPTFLMYYAGGFPAAPLITHVHMQALPANRHFIEALDLKPVVMIRSIPDMLASYGEMMDPDPLSPENWLNIKVPENYPRLGIEAKGDFLVDMMAPWYASYFATWLEYARREPDRVLVLNYDAFRADPVSTLEAILIHSRMPRTREQCRMALNEVWEERAAFRFNKGVPGRGQARFAADQLARLRRQVEFFPELESHRDALIPTP
jgi:hypothetical protein